MKILLYGYYNKCNFGDDLFEFILKQYLDSKNILYIVKNASDLNETYNINLNIDMIMFGGGEIINDYFLIPIFKYIKYNELYNIPIYGTSIGFDNYSNSMYISFFDKCIFRNNLNIIDNVKYFFDNDLIFGLKKYYNPVFKVPIKNTIGYYLIDKINDETLNLLIDFTNIIKNTYIINFVVFDKTTDIIIINNIIKTCKLNNFNIIIKNDILETINEILLNNKHLCIRFHSHVICYLYKLQFISIPLTSKVTNFNNLYNIKNSLILKDILNLLDNQNIIFENIDFNFSVLDSFFDSDFVTSDKSTSIWNIYCHIYDNFLIILKNKNDINDINEKITYISDQIELNILLKINTIYKYGIEEKIKKLILDNNVDNYNLQIQFIRILTNLNNYKKLNI